jgi:hypothetical protein
MRERISALAGCRSQPRKLPSAVTAIRKAAAAGTETSLLTPKYLSDISWLTNSTGTSSNQPGHPQPVVLPGLRIRRDAARVPVFYLAYAGQILAASLVVLSMILVVSTLIAAVLLITTKIFSSFVH